MFLKNHDALAATVVFESALGDVEKLMDCVVDRFGLIKPYLSSIISMSRCIIILSSYEVSCYAHLPTNYHLAPCWYILIVISTHIIRSRYRHHNYLLMRV